MSGRPLATLGAVVALALPAAAAPRRIAVLIGSNEGSAELRPLRFAEEDAAKLGAVLTELGGVQPADLLLLKGPSLTAVHAAFDEARRRVQEAHSEHTVLIVFFSGHSDGAALELGAERLGFAELKQFMEGTGATVRLAIVDSCRSGALFSAKGGAPGPSFELRLSDDDNAGTVLLTSSAADEQALESKEIGGSFFTHHFVSGLRGAADAQGNGRVTLGEAYRYAYARTVRNTADTLNGPQHPGFDYRLTGKGELVLTELSRRSAALVLPAGVERALAIDKRRDQVVAEGAGGARLSLPPGDYEVRAWQQGKPAQATVRLQAGETLRLDAAAMAPVSAPILSRKGEAWAGGERTTGAQASLEPGSQRGSGAQAALDPQGSASGTQAPLDPALRRPEPPRGRQDPGARANALTFDPVFLAVQTLSLHYQRALAPGWAATVKLRAGVLPESSPMLKLLGGGAGTTVLGGALGASWFPSGQALEGFFLGPGVDVFRIARGGAPAGVLVPSFELGNAWLWPSGFDLTLAVGAQYGAVFSGKLADGDAQLGLFPRAGLRLGYAW